MVARIAFLLCLIAATASPVWACGILQHADPKVGSTVSMAPSQITLTFSQSVIPAESTVTLTDTTGKTLPLAKPIPSSDDTVLSLKTATPLPPGKYKVHWNILWKDCGSQTQGSYSFTIQPH